MNVVLNVHNLFCYDNDDEAEDEDEDDIDNPRFGECVHDAVLFIYFAHYKHYCIYAQNYAEQCDLLPHLLFVLTNLA